MLNSALHGFAMALSLIVPIGAQNAFVLKQGLKQQHVFAICLCCALSDAILISSGVLGFSELVTLHPHWLNIARYLGATFLLLYGAQHFYQAWKDEQHLEISSTEVPSLGKVLFICLGLTWLNPHVYLDTVVLLGSISTQYPDTQLYFALGAISASFLFFFSLGYAARYLQPIFQRPKAWKILDIVIGGVMWSIAISLLN
ncbi:LysE/ArgO family amino acid transporter [Acinetobacter kookii]|uniref:L-lysine exporter family protein LysE/ArgO n=1 Tax=Acinetobacter kookii TaxID=1226327 RepID=A0A1G6H3A2_9GAMM|nr:LysE/ArgO family amino acid transporter [Acinetobacter kookii]SDB87906.1 L-lysine exporter family protein LysE/ArgO [Acinetobacter kookii]